MKSTHIGIFHLPDLPSPDHRSHPILLPTLNRRRVPSRAVDVIDREDSNHEPDGYTGGQVHDDEHELKVGRFWL